MLWLVGIGIGGYRGLSLAALDTLKQCDIVYVEQFTSALSDGDVQGLNSLLPFEVKPVRRWFVEDGRQILEESKTKQVAIVTYGDPLIATTHSELRTRAAKNSIKTSVLHSASGISSTIGETGLHAYKFGRMVTMMSDRQSAVTVYNTIFENLLAGNHTVILTEYRYDDNRETFFLDPITVLEMLTEVEADQKYHAFSEDTFAIVASRIGMESQQILSGKITSLVQSEFGEGPHTIIIPGRLHFTESDAIVLLTRNIDLPTNNSDTIKKISSQMVERYAPRARQAVEHMRRIIREYNAEKSMHDILDNAECYIADAERFLNQGKFDLAVLSIGYAEGLVDAIRFQKGINPWATGN